MQKIICILLAATWLLSCNKVIDEVELPPFSVFPNPFTDVFSVYIDNQIGTQSSISVKVLNGKDEEIAKFEAATPGSNFQVNMNDQEKGIYYVELTVSGDTFTLPVLKAE